MEIKIRFAIVLGKDIKSNIDKITECIYTIKFLRTNLEEFMKD